MKGHDGPSQVQSAFTCKETTHKRARTRSDVNVFTSLHVKQPASAKITMGFCCRNSQINHNNGTSGVQKTI